jgi:hypothetical protein
MHISNKNDNNMVIGDERVAHLTNTLEKPAQSLQNNFFDYPFTPTAKDPVNLKNDNQIFKNPPNLNQSSDIFAQEQL